MKGINAGDSEDEIRAKLIASELTKSLEYLSWALQMIDDQFAKTGEIGVAESIVWKSANAFVREHKEAAEKRLKELDAVAKKLRELAGM